MKRLGWSNRVLLTCVLIACSCERQKKTTATATPRSGSLTGVIRTDAPTPPDIALPENVHKVCGLTLPDASLQRDEGGALANAVVWVEDAKATPLGEGKPLLDQQKCAYLPPVLVAHTGGRLRVKNSDPLMHNVRAGSLFNVGMPVENQVIERALPDTAGPVQIVCDVHPWMRADVMVLPHDTWAVTDAHGRFTLTNVEAGKRPVHVWHPLRGEKTVTVEVTAGGEAQLETTL
ncbi:MAG: hypothetical protein JNK82_11375 [Myxococcaceae bacterium]|nr:hypothetical protein [Myxococcaceae bacterium]